MNTSGNRHFTRSHGLIQTGFLLLTLAMIVQSGRAASPDNEIQLRLNVTGDGEQRVTELNWTGTPGAIYKVQTRDSLEPATPWSTIDIVRPGGSLGQFRLAPDKMEAGAEGVRRSRFFQLALPQAEIFGIEPALLPPAGGEVYIVGQCLSSNGVLRIGGVVCAVIPGGSVLQSALSHRCVVPALEPGVYDVEWVEDGVVVARIEKGFTVTTPPGISQRLLEPPMEPPASPRLSGFVAADPDNGDVVNSILPAALKVKEKGNRTKCTSNLRTMATGEFQWQEMDLAIPGVGLDFAWVRTYRSRTGTTTPMGVYWDHSYNVRITDWNEASGHMDLWDGTGRSDRFYRDASGIYTRDENFCIATVSNAQFTVTFPDTGRWEFNVIDGSPAAGKLARIVDRNANTIALHYDDAGRLTTIVDTLGRSNTLAYLGSFISTLTDFSGRVVRFTHSRAVQGAVGGALTSVTTPAVTNTPNGNDFPNGKTTRYGYSSGFADERLNFNLTSITDPKNQIWLQVVYRTSTDPASPVFDTVDYIQRGAYRDKLRRFPQTPSPDNAFAVVKCIVNDAVGNVSEYYFDSMNRCVRRVEFTGRASPDLPTTETQNRPTGKLRATDPDFFETRYEWNADSLCTRIIEPRGSSTEMVYQRAFNQNSSRSNHTRRHDGNLRVLRDTPCCGDLDGDGKEDIERAWRLDYGPTVGAAPVLFRKFNKKADESYQPWETEDEDAGVVSNPLYEDKGNSGHNPLYQSRFATQVTDPRGTVSTRTLDDRGNVRHVETFERRSGAVIAGDFEYNTRGQVTSIMHPLDGEGCRRVDDFEYYDDPSATGYGFLKKSTKDKGGFVCGNTSHFLIATTYEYDALGNVTRRVDPRGNDTLVEYNSRNQPTKVTVPKQTQGTTFGERVRQVFSYDENDNVTQIDEDNRDHNAQLDPVNPQWTTTFQFDALDRCELLGHELTHTAQQGQRSATTRFVYDGKDNVVAEHSPVAVSGVDPNAIVTLEYDERNLLLRRTRAPGTEFSSSDEFDYDANGNCALVRNGVATGAGAAAGAARTAFTFDGFDRCVRITDAMGNVTHRRYDANDNLVWTRFDGETNDVEGGTLNRRLSETQFEFDSANRLVATSTAFFDIFTELAIGDGQSTSTRSYAPNGSVLTETDDNGRVTRYAYDSANRLSRVTDPATNVTSYAYDPNGNITSAVQIDRSDVTPQTEQRFSVTHEYDPQDRCVRSTDNLGNSDEYSYDSRGNLARHRDARGTLFGWSHDGLGRTILLEADLDGDGEFEPLEVLGSKEWDDNSRLTASVDANGNRTTYFYDPLDRCTEERRADGSRAKLVWSPRSNLVLEEDANGTVISNRHDFLNRRVRSEIKPAAGVAATTTFELFEYDGLSRCILASNDVSRLEFTHDSLGNREKMKQDCLMFAATFDGEGNRLSLAYPGGRTAQFTYDALNRVTGVGVIHCTACSAQTLQTRAYDGPGRVARIARGNGVNTRINWNGHPGSGQIAEDFGWGQVVRVNHARSGAGGQQVIDQRIFTYDRAQNKTLRAQTTAFSTGGPLQTNSFAFNKLHRLTRASRVKGSTDDYARVYALDTVGNRQQVEQNGVVQTYQMDTTLPEPADFQMNQYSLTPFGAQQYDRNGNLILRDGPAGPTQFHYDYANRLVSVERTVGPALVPVAGFSYDAFGRRISKTVFPPAPQAPITTQFLLDPDSDDDGDILEERETGEVRKTYVIPHVFDQKGRVMIAADGAVFYFHEDDLGSTLAITDATGAVVERYDYDDFGVPSFLDSKGAPLTGDDGSPATQSRIGNRFLFHGMIWDGDTGLYLETAKLSKADAGRCAAIYYDPNTGKELTHVHGDPHVDQKDGTRWDRMAGNFANGNPWSAKVVEKATSGLKDTLKTQVRMAGGGGGGGIGGSGGPATAQYNPKEIGIDKSVPWQKSKSGQLAVYFNPKELSVRKVTVRGWNPEKKEAIIGNAKKEEGGRHTPFHNKYRPQFFLRTTDVTGEIELESGREMVACPNSNGRLYGPGAAHWGSARLIVPIAMDKGLRFRATSGRYTTVSNVLKTKHDTAKNSVGNIR